ncbi:polyprenol monophosphomannose synthase [Actinocrispum sp. NPDC049592]|uniref:polyprenol monophosphomannose synthase n=1 Tax=Actinocrispum sp. NPDC049592 TaxID=3154835 RepID=UPI00341C1EEA
MAELEPVLVVIPTYNERENITRIIDRLQAAVPKAHVLVVDDGSPDGTGEIADKLAAADERVHVMHRTEKAGLGAAYVAGFTWALERDYNVIVEMDADGSHAPEDLPRIIAALSDADLSIGSRYVKGGKTVNWPWRRYMLSKGANLYSRIWLGAKVNDMTAGFRAFRRAALEKLKLHNVASAGYCFQIDLTYRTLEAGFTVVESPITFTEREIGVSKMDGSIVREALWRVFKWGVRLRGEQLRSLLRIGNKS